jgi:hypothetical protein
MIALLELAAIASSALLSRSGALASAPSDTYRYLRHKAQMQN